MASTPTTQPSTSGTKVFLGVCLVIVVVVLLGVLVAKSILPSDRIETVKVQTELFDARG